jgi:hypothetical protein
MSSARRICYTAGYDGDQRESIKSPSLRESSELGDYARVAGNADTTLPTLVKLMTHHAFPAGLLLLG